MGIFDSFFNAQADPNAAGAVLTPEQIQLRQLMAQRLMQQGGDTSPISSPWQGAARLAQGLIGGLQERRINQQQAAQRALGQTKWGDFTNGLTGGAPPAAPATGGSADNSSNSGLDPIQLASYLKGKGATDPGSPDQHFRAYQ